MKKPEQQLAHFVTELRAEEVPPEAQRTVRLMVMAVCGTGIAGASEDGVQALRELLCEAGGAAQATTLMSGVAPFFVAWAMLLELGRSEVVCEGVPGTMHSMTIVDASDVPRINEFRLLSGRAISILRC